MSTSQKPLRKQAHNLSSEELETLQVKQIQGDPIKQVAGNMDDRYRFDVHEKHLVHAEITTIQKDPNGNDLPQKFVQKFYPQEFAETEGSGGFRGKKVAVLHDPTHGDAIDIDDT